MTLWLDKLKLLLCRFCTSKVVSDSSLSQRLSKKRAYFALMSFNIFKVGFMTFKRGFVASFLYD